MTSIRFEMKTPEDIAERLKKFKFRQRFFGGVDEKNVWEGIGKLDAYYRQVFDYQEARLDALLHERDEMIRRLMRENQKLRSDLSGLQDKDQHDK